jgi:hypothetical protein
MTLSYPVPFRFAEDFTRALITSACEALRHGDQVAAIHRSPDGTYEVSDIRIPPIFPPQAGLNNSTQIKRPPSVRARGRVYGWKSNVSSVKGTHGNAGS